MRSRVVSTLALGLTLVLGACAAPSAPVPDAETMADAGVPTPIMELELGACLNDASAPERADTDTLLVVECEEPHDSELYAILAIEDSTFPGEAALTEEGSARCAAVFGDFIGVDFRSSVLDFHFYHPTASSWVEGDRSIYCMAIDPGLQLTGSLLGVQR